MAKNNQEFQEFLKGEVNVGQARLDRLETGVGGVNDYLKDHLTGYQTMERQGSYAMGTLIKPVDDNDEYDADIQIVMTPNPTWQAKDYLNQIHNTLKQNRTFANRLGRKTRCVSVNYVGDFHLDIVPLVTIRGKHYICNWVDNEFEETDGTGYRDWFNEKNRITRGNLKRVVRLLKYLRDHQNNYTAKSILLTTLIGNAIYPPDEGTEAVSTVSDTLDIVLTRMDDYLQKHPAMPEIRNPVIPSENFSHHWDQTKYANFRQIVHSHAQIAKEARATLSSEASIKVWQKLFSDFAKGSSGDSGKGGGSNNAVLLVNGDVYAGDDWMAYLGTVDQSAIANLSEATELSGPRCLRGWLVQVPGEFEHLIPLGRIRGLQIDKSAEVWRVKLKDGVRFLRTIRLENILSYGPCDTDFPLEPLNVLIGPNASGKSNLIEALSLLTAAPKDLQAPIREGGGVRDWLWTGAEQSSTATVDVTVAYGNEQMPLRYRLSFNEVGTRFNLQDEAIENEKPAPPNVNPYFYYRYQEGRPVLNVFSDVLRFNRQLRREDVKSEQSILSQRRDPDSYPELMYLAERFERIKFYREWNFGRYTPARRPQKSDLPQDSLLEDASNLGVVLSDLLNRPHVKGQILEHMRTFYQGIKDIVVHTSGGLVQVFFHEEGLRNPVPATRLSDGSLRYLCLLAVLCHPEPPPVICIEEPEIGLHPDIIPEMANLLVEASARSQIFVTTHSDILVDALTDTPDSVIICEKSDGATQLRRLDSAEIKSWLERYKHELGSLGDLWVSGEIGGTRW